MSYEIYRAETFQKSLKNLRKRFRNIKKDILPVPAIQVLGKDPSCGRPISGWKKRV